MFHGLPTAIKLPHTIVKEEVEDKLARAVARCLKSVRYTVVGKASVLEPGHTDGVALVPLLEDNVVSRDPRDLKLHQAHDLVFKTLFEHIRQWRLECDILGHKLTELREDAFGLHVRNVVRRQLQRKAPYRPVQGRVALLVRLRLVSSKAIRVQLQGYLQGEAVHALARGRLEVDELREQRREVHLEQIGYGPLTLTNSLELV
mmetsp:Transcript_33747/g.96515  ORF Transcript_33747/g.96515 Transcript_33747/m.96515 type:complete len:203 (+) Transcript_33747:208-816(+)